MKTEHSTSLMVILRAWDHMEAEEIYWCPCDLWSSCVSTDTPKNNNHYSVELIVCAEVFDCTVFVEEIMNS